MNNGDTNGLESPNHHWSPSIKSSPRRRQHHVDHVTGPFGHFSVNRPHFTRPFPGNEHGTLKNGEEYLSYAWKLVDVLLPYEGLRYSIYMYLAISSTFEETIHCFHFITMSFLWRKLKTPSCFFFGVYHPESLTISSWDSHHPHHGSCFLALQH